LTRTEGEAVNAHIEAGAYVVLIKTEVKDVSFWVIKNELLMPYWIKLINS
jgi:hypothetical protein